MGRSVEGEIVLMTACGMLDDAVAHRRGGKQREERQRKGEEREKKSV